MATLYFPNLNGLRFLAATLVIVHHIEQYKHIFNIPNLWSNPFIYQSGKLGVVLFFVLSGFLITYLLLNEKRNKGSISLKNFYVRRILKIWPLYFLIVALGFFILPNITLFDTPTESVFAKGFPLKSFISYMFMFPNLALSNFEIIPFASQAWSIGTEEQFYLIWPLIFIYLYSRSLQSMVAVILGYLALKYLFFFLQPNIFGINILAFWNTFNIDCMAIGGIVAYCQFYNFGILRFLKNDFVFISTILVTTILMALGIKFGSIHTDIYASLFVIIILNLACNPRYSKLLEFEPINYLGTISYGIYMYHSIAIVASIKILNMVGLNNNWTLYLLVFALTILICHLSYKYFEKPILKLKSKFL